MERVRTSELKTGSKTTRNFLERSSVMKFLLKLTGVFGVSLVMSGMLLQVYTNRLLGALTTI